MHSDFSSTTLVRVMRSGQIESEHRGSVAVTDARGHLIAWAGDPELPVYWRSVAKPIQAIPLVALGGRTKLELTRAELAVICASHHGEPEHVRQVEQTLARIGVGPEVLRCGTQEPLAREAAADLIRRCAKPTVLHNMCSGNHAGLVGLSRLLGTDPASYIDPGHRAQQVVLEMVARFTDLRPDEIYLGVDGCGIPAYRTALHRVAVAFARLFAPPADWPEEVRNACREVVSAMTEHPDLISRTGEVDTELIRAFEGSAVCKLGAESVCGMAFAPCEQWPAGLGLSIKIADGLGNRARALVLLECLEQLGIGSVQQRRAFAGHVERDLKTRAGARVGGLETCFELHRDGGSRNE